MPTSDRPVRVPTRHSRIPVRALAWLGVLAVVATSVTIAAIRSGSVTTAPNSADAAVQRPPIVASTRDPAVGMASTGDREYETRLAYVSVTIERDLYSDGMEAGLSEALVSRLAEIFAWDIDFARHVQPGDSLAVVYEERYWLGQKVADGQIRAAEFVNGGTTYRAIAQRDEYGFTHYYTPNGMSMQRMFLRAPLEYTRISSGYTLKRFHPILKSWTAHRGIDYAAATGTPVRATATGRILAIGNYGGYGKRIVLTHGGQYNTLYAHLSRFQPGLREGSLVEQGQIIGYVGATGLATGPHLHYEFHVNGKHHDPLRFRFPGATPIAARWRPKFDRNMRELVAQLDRISAPARFAAAQ
jgi:murein DD-endopeptidase MepM/ murein hydrolase activator NlpD